MAFKGSENFETWFLVNDNISLRGIFSSCKQFKSYFRQVLNSRLFAFLLSHILFCHASVGPRAEVTTMDALKSAFFYFRPFGANLVQ